VSPPRRLRPPAPPRAPHRARRGNAARARPAARQRPRARRRLLFTPTIHRSPALFPPSRSPLPSPPPPLRRTQAAKGGEEGGKAFDRSVYGIVASNANYITLGSCLDSAGFEGTLTGAGPFTLFAPNDDAFAGALKALGTTKLELRNLPALPDILKNHVVSGSVLAGDLKEGQELTTLGGGKLTVTLAGGAKVNGVKVTKTDIKATNGIIHAVAGVLTP
jgi:uncharacterized surface protein with fasciclin (FAS1) repeats